MDDPDSDYVRRSLKDGEAFAVLFDRHAARLYRYVVRRVGPDLAEDLVGEVFLTAFRRRKAYDDAYPDARPWLYGIATKLIARHHRTEAARYRALARSPVEDTEESPADRVASIVTAEGVARLLVEELDRMPRLDREVLLLIAWADFTYEQVAKALDIPIGTVRSRLHRLRHRLRGSLGEDIDIDEVVA